MSARRFQRNVLINLFARTGYELANIYCKPGLPDNDICTRYFQLTDKMALDNILHGTPMGACVSPDTGSSGEAIQGENKRFYDFFQEEQPSFLSVRAGDTVGLCRFQK